MRYISTNHNSKPQSLKEAIMRSESSDGGLYIPECLPVLPQAIFNNIAEMSPYEISYFVSNSLIGDDLPADIIKEIGDEAFSFPLPLVQVEPNIYAFELFHGDTMSVKDLPLRYMARTLVASQTIINKPLNVLVATTGNSGKAVAHGFHNVRNVNVFVLYPKSIPASQVESITSLGGNIYAIPVNGTIDDCRNIVAQALSDKKFNEENLTTCANSSNIGRILPQIICYFIAYSALQRRKPKSTNIVISVPCGNCGNLLAGYFAMQMGLPIKRLIAANNENNPFGNFLTNGLDAQRNVSKHTLAYAMDSCRATNLPRFNHICKGNPQSLSDKISAHTCSDDEIRATIKDVHDRCGYLLDPHSAVAYKCLKQDLAPGEIGIFLATANPNKSSSLISEILDKDIQPDKPSYCCIKAKGKEQILPPTFPAFKKFFNSTIKKYSK